MDLGLVNVATIRIALQHGGTSAFLLGMGSAIGDLAYFTLASFGAATLTRWAPFRWTLWIAGTATLLFLSGRMIHETLRPKSIQTSGDAPARSAVGLLMSG